MQVDLLKKNCPRLWLLNQRGYLWLLFTYGCRRRAMLSIWQLWLVLWNSIWQLQRSKKNVSANQRPAWPSWLSARHKMHKLGEGCWILAICQVLLNSIQWLLRRSRTCLSQSESRAPILFFRWFAAADSRECVELCCQAGVYTENHVQFDISISIVAEHNSVSELGRLLQLILGCAVNCAAKQEYIQRIMSMEESVQHVVMTAIQEVWASLCTEHAGIFYFCCVSKAMRHIGITLSIVRLSCFAFAGATCVPQNTGCKYLSGQTDK